MRLDSASLAELRDQLRQRGKRTSLLPPPLAEGRESQPLDGPLSAEALAVVQRVSPMCEVLYLLLMADGREDARELELLRGAVRALTDGALRSKDIEDMLAVFRERLKSQTREQRLDQVTAELANDRSDAEATFMLAAAMVIADELPSPQEQKLVAELRQLLAISLKRASALLGELLGSGD